MANFNLDGKQIQQLTNGSPGVWTTNCGTLWQDAAATVAYAGASVTSVYFKANNTSRTDGTVSVNAAVVHTINIIGVYPIRPQWQSAWRPDKRGVITNVKRDGSRNGRVLGNGQLVRDYNLLHERRLNEEYDEWEAFYGWHFPHLVFKYSDPHLVVVALYQFEGASAKISEEGLNEWTCQIIHVGAV
jgi:hypothetical protein